MFLILFTIYSLSHYSLQPPFKITNESLPEIGNWTLRDSAINMKNFIRLTPSYQFISGGICERVPMYSSDWSFEANLSTGSHYGGNGFSFFYSSSLCASNIFHFNGLSAWINTTSTTDDGEEVYLLNSTGNLNLVDLKPVCRIKSQNGPFIFRITKRGDQITIDSKQLNFINEDQAKKNETLIDQNIKQGDQKSQDFEYISKYYKNINGTYIDSEGFALCTSQHIDNVINNGYFSLFSSTQELYDDHDLHGINVTLLSAYKEPENDNSSIINRKYLDKYYQFRKKLKILRRSKMPMMMKYVNISKDNKYSIDSYLGKTKLNETEIKSLFKESFPIIKESIERAGSTVTALQIKKFFLPIIRAQLEKATAIIEVAENMLPDVRELLKDIWNECEISLTEIAANISIQMEHIENDATKYAKNLMGIDQYSSDVFISMIKNSYGDIGYSPISYVLATICAIELVAYVIFFIYQRKRTMDFKKIS